MRQSRKSVSFQATDVWAVACKAQRLNKEYIKFVPEGSKKETNRETIYRLLEEGPAHITVADKEEGVKVRQHFQGLTFKLLTGSFVSEFDKTAMAIADKDTITSRLDIAIIASLPQSYERASRRKAEAMEIAKLSSDKKIGKIKDRVDRQVTVLKCILSKKWDCFFITGITTDDEIVFFGSSTISKNAGDIIDIKGTVKGYKLEDGNVMTQLNRVKLITVPDLKHLGTLKALAD